MVEQEVAVVFNEQVALDTFLMGLQAKEVVREAAPGHFVMVRVHKGFDPLLRRPFSIAGTLGGDLFLILYRVVGQGTGILAEVRSGSRLSVLGPLGNGFRIVSSGTSSCLVGGGMGVAPLLFLAQRLNGMPFSFLAGYGNAAQIPALDSFGLNPETFHIATEDGSRGHHGMVTDLLEEEVARLKEPVALFTCGPRPMMSRVAELALEQGLPCQVSLEAEMACGLGACQGCAVEASSATDRFYLHVCTDGPVLDAGRVAW
ncbi:MAG: dihydroorotate dehydrogenase electron transfer subunit [Deltaproteobacteria bacterium]|nr:dihydroorotate dehydrogenase electron transfer subunit [Deltaproteobacteria bacterium]MBW1923818.1 dihydroorotate dehydrogenase electron transfer subunit [Deltaproteobacteria bacterium]MBW1948535.1 dihydroorotate dehydrogenase electron transfer subunit [Deltaproteobacteria bacterium]MBW2006963.1 dihydroorotate dehydrogenase electron transfer subunit [Deltaproteobacteria bacterium]MBW2103189.1 dihydroorotate dehydrogenase electron transfer subunit [Deltaproteobacteria bacterium]